MRTISFAFLKSFDWILVAILLLLTATGLTMIYSIGWNLDPPDLLKFQKQLIFFGLGFVFFIVLTLTDYRSYLAYTWIFYGLVLSLLVFVLFVGTEIRGTRGWFVFFGQSILQPIEIAKPFFVLVLAKWFSSRISRLNEWSTYLIPLGFTALPVGLGLMQPDFGSPFLFVCVWFGYLFVLRAPKKIMFTLLGSGVVVAVIAWFFVFSTIQRQRIQTFLNPGSDPLGSGYHVTQSIIAVGSGQWFGRGLGLGSQSQLNFLPEQETDFIFAVIAEELGAVGAILVFALFAVLFARMIRISKAGPDEVGSLYVIGLVILIATQILINVGMNIGIMPVTGIPLPFISSGGSSLLALYLSFGIVHSIACRKRLFV